MPEEPEYYHLCGAANTSKNQIVARLKTNGDLGLIINATELDTISGSMKQDYGKHDDVFRAAFHHEPVATDFKVDRQMICAEEPRLALCLSGTPNQLPIFIHSTDDGGYSRRPLHLRSQLEISFGSSHQRTGRLRQPLQTA